MLIVAAIIMQQASQPKWSNPRTDLAPGVIHAELKSKLNGVNVGYAIYLPKSYETSKKRYPLILFLHGAGGSETSDSGPGGFTAVVEKAVQAKAFPESVILFANGRMSGYRDHAEAKEYVESFLIKELIPHIEETYRTGGSRDMRALCGFSMGGAGSCRLSLNHPDFFAAAIAWGGSVREGDSKTISLLKDKSAELRKGDFRLFLGVGEKDDFAQATEFRGALEKAGIKHQYVVLPGIGHDLGAYYNQTAEAAFRFISPSIKNP
jgi:enterochelin esterase-like enzyme